MEDGQVMNLSSIFSNKKESAVSPLNDPFKKDCIHEFHVHMFTECVSPYNKYFIGRVCFKNGQTSGEQSFPRTDSFEKLIKDMEAFVNSFK